MVSWVCRIQNRSALATSTDSGRISEARFIIASEHSKYSSRYSYQPCIIQISTYVNPDCWGVFGFDVRYHYDLRLLWKPCKVHTLSIGHSDSGNFKKTGPFCHALFNSISFGFLPRVSQSALFCPPATQHQSLGLVPL